MRTGSLTYADLYDMAVVLDELYPGFSHPDQSGEQINRARRDGIITCMESRFMMDPEDAR